MVTPQARALRPVVPGLSLVEAIRSILADLDARFGSWKLDDEECDEPNCADPQLVAVLEFLARLLPDGPDETPVVRGE